jgi:hypothetical protein
LPFALPFALSLSWFTAGFLRLATGGAQGAHAGSMSAGRFAKDIEVREWSVPNALQAGQASVVAGYCYLAKTLIHLPFQRAVSGWKSCFL